MKRGGKDDRFIQTVSEHVVLATLGNYDPEPEMTERLDGALAIMTVQKPKIRRRVETVTTEVTRKVSKTSIHDDSAVERSRNNRKVTRKVSKTSIHDDSAVERSLINGLQQRGKLFDIIHFFKNKQ